MRTPTEDTVESVDHHRRQKRRAAMPFAVLATSLVAVVVVAAYVGRLEEQRDHEQFENAAQSVADRIGTRVKHYGDLLVATAGFFALGEGKLSPGEFHDYVQRLDLPGRFPGIQGIGFSSRLIAGETDEQLREVWELPRDVALGPPTSSDGGTRHVVVMIEPLDGGNRSALGLGYQGRPEVRAAMQRACDVGQPAATVMLALEGEERKPNGFLVFVPVFRPDHPTASVAERREALDGYVFGILRASDFFLGIFGTEVAPRVGFEVFDGEVVDPARRLHRTWPAALEGQPMPYFDEKTLHADGHPWTLRIHGRGAARIPVVPFVLATGFATAALLFVTMLLQVRGRHAAESTALELRRSSRMLRRSERRLRTLIERLPEAVAVYLDGKMVFGNPALELMLRSSTSVTGSDALATVAPEDRPKLARALEVFRASEESGPVAVAETVPLEVRFLGGETGSEPVQTEGFLLPIEFDGLPAVLGVWRDVTQRRQLVARMMQMDRMIAVGTLAAGVAHEINNPLAFVMANLEYALGELGHADSPPPATVRPQRTPVVDAEVVQALVEARDGAERVRRIVRDLKTYSRGSEDGTQVPALVDVRRAITWACAMADNEIRHRARLVIDAAEVAPVGCDEARLGQVLLNLVMNASQAIAEGAAERNEIRVTARNTDNQQVLIEVRDTGEGIAPENLARIFDPFFTTKPVGLGTGLGLAIVQRIVTGCGGQLTVESVEGKGSTFQVTLPASPRGPAVVAPTRTERAPARSSSPPAEQSSRRPRVLVIDDEIQVLRSIQRNLGPTHEVVLVPRAEEALSMLDSGERFDAVVCDLMMPEMTGMDLHAALVAAGSPVARSMVFITGGAFTPRAREFLDSVDNPRLEKPFPLSALLAAIATSAIAATAAEGADGSP